MKNKEGRTTNAAARNPFKIFALNYFSRDGNNDIELGKKECTYTTGRKFSTP
jgi:hypothetical protein